MKHCGESPSEQLNLTRMNKKKLVKVPAIPIRFLIYGDTDTDAAKNGEIKLLGDTRGGWKMFKNKNSLFIRMNNTYLHRKD